MPLPSQCQFSVRLFAGLCGLLILWLSWAPLTLAITVQDVPNPRQTSGGWVTDLAALLSPEAEAQINQIATELEANTQAELAVVTVPTTAPAASPKAFATQLFHTWGIGKADRDNGLLLLVSRDDRRVEIETGRGTATILPDADVARLIETVIVPHFRQEDYAGGIIQATQQLADEISTHRDRLRQFVIPTVIWVLLGVGVLGLLGMIGLLRWRSRRPTPLTMGEQQTQSDWLYPSNRQAWVGHHPPLRWTGLFLPPVLITVALGLYGLTAVALTATRYWGGQIFSLSLLIPSLAVLVMMGNLLLFLMGWLMNHERLRVALQKAIRPKWEDVLSLTLLVTIGLFILQGLVSIVGWAPLGGIWRWMQQRPLQTAGLMVGLSPLLSSKLVQAFEQDSLRYRKQQQAFCCDRCRTALHPLSSDQLEPLLTSEEQASLAAETVKIVGWHCPTCHPTLDRATTNLQMARIYVSRPSAAFGSGTGGRSDSAVEPSSSTNDYEPSYYPEPSSSSDRSDFGGGVSDGGGAGENW